MGLGQTKSNSMQQQSAQDIHKQKQAIQFKQNDFIRQFQGSIKQYYDILSPCLKENQFYQLRKAIHLKTKLVRSVYIINKYKVRTNQRGALQKQIDKLKLIDHPNLNKIYQLFKDHHHYFIVMELCYGRSLAHMLELQYSISEKRAANIMYQLFNVLGHCHKRQIQHTDLKLENIIFTSQRQDIIKIIDFSISKIFRIQQIIEQSKAKAFLSSPEQLRNQISTKSDIWQCGMILYILLCGEAPLIGNKRGPLTRRISYYLPTFTQKKFQFVSREAKDFIRSLLHLNAQQRPTAQMCLEDPWMKKYYKQPLISQINLKRCLQQCYHFNPLSKLQQATWTFFVNALVSFSEKQNIQYVFSYLDKQANGELYFDDLALGFLELYQNQEKANFYASLIFRRLKRQKLTFSHFVTISTNRMFLVTEPNIKKIFEIFDEDSSGEISVSELKNVLGASKQVSEQIWLDLMKQADANSDGMISFEQFRDMMRSLLKRQSEQLYEQVQLKINQLSQQSDFSLN